MSKPGKFYMLVNPYVHGEIQTIFQADNSMKAAKEAYKEISQYFNSAVYNYKFSLLKLSSDKVNKTENINLSEYGRDKNLYHDINFSHFIVKEAKNNNEVKFVIHKYTGDVDKKNTNYLLSNINSIQVKYDKEKTNNIDSSLSGGKKKHKTHKKHKKHKKNDDSDDSDDSSSSSSSSPDYYVKKRNHEKFFWWYYPTYYLDTNPLIYLPTFSDSVVFTNAIDISTPIINSSSVNLGR